ncbi:hypothetical protein [Lamprocystis purpurea]|nr:hypothetical protein [Lamprocystis purpurea]
MSLDLWVGLAVLAGLLVAEGALPYYEARMSMAPAIPRHRLRVSASG